MLVYAILCDLLIGNIRYVRPGPSIIYSDTFNFTAPLTIEFYVYLYYSRNNNIFFQLLNSTSLPQIGLSWNNNNYHVIYDTCDKTCNSLPLYNGNMLPTGVWYHVAVAWTGTNVSVYQDAVLQNPGFSPSPCALTSTSFMGTVNLYTNAQYNFFRELRAVSYIKSPDEILRYKRKNHYYSSGYDNSPLFLFYYPLDDISSSFCYRNLVGKSYHCTNPALISNTGFTWWNLLFPPLFICPDSLVYNTTINKCEYGQAYPGYNVTFLLNGSNINPSKQVLTFWCWIYQLPAANMAIASYQYNSNK